MEVRCDNRILFGILEDGVLEVRCRSNRCGHEAGAVVIHRFLIQTGELLETRKFKDPTYRKEAVGNDRTTLRSA